MIRGGGAEMVGQLLEEAKAAKPERHALRSGIHPEDRHMFQVGG